MQNKIEKILKTRNVAGKEEYLIKWEGLPPTKNTWECFDNVLSYLEMAENKSDELHQTKPSQAAQSNTNDKKQMPEKILSSTPSKSKQSPSIGENMKPPIKTCKQINFSFNQFIDKNLKEDSEEAPFLSKIKKGLTGNKRKSNGEGGKKRNAPENSSDSDIYYDLQQKPPATPFQSEVENLEQEKLRLAAREELFQQEKESFNKQRNEFETYRKEMNLKIQEQLDKVKDLEDTLFIDEYTKVFLKAPTPARILGIRQVPDKEIEYAIEWTKTGERPIIACFPSSLLKKAFPRLMVNYLESHLSFPNTSDTSTS